jgi:hypothetical protein
MTDTLAAMSMHGTSEHRSYIWCLAAILHSLAHKGSYIIYIYIREVLVYASDMKYSCRQGKAG